jgi:hypothetical protein
MNNLGLRVKILLPVIVFGVLLVVGIGLHIANFSREQTTQSSLVTATGLANQIRELRGYYTKKVVSNAKKNDMVISHDYAQRDDAIPLPATMVHELTKILSDKEGYSIRLYSEFPFPFRSNGGPHDAFEREALEELKKNPKEPFWRERRC